MGLTTALYTGLSGLNASSQGIEVVGNNIANVNTTSFKGSRIDFETQFSQTLKQGSAPSADLGGSSPSQIGLGVLVGAVTRDNSQGSLQPTGRNTDLAIEGNGFFVLNINGAQRFTRAGTFQLDRDFNLVDPKTGGLVQGFGVDDDFNVLETLPQDVNIPLGQLTIAEPTTTVNFGGELNTAGNVATTGTFITTDPIFSNAAGTVPAAATDALTSLFDSSGTNLFTLGDVITTTGISKGGSILPDHSFEVGSANTTGSDDFGTTLQDYLDFMQETLGIDTSVSGGVSVTGAGELSIVGNTGTVNNIKIDNANIVINLATTPVPLFNFPKLTDIEADGESVRTTFVAFDSLGSSVNIDLSIVLESKTNSGSNWRFYAQSEDDSDLDRVLGTGLLTFDTNGRLLGGSGQSITIDLDNTGAFSPQQISLSFDGNGGQLSALGDVISQFSATSLDGSAAGTLEDFTIGESGTISGVFSNGLIRDVGRVVLAKFANSGGLTDLGGNTFDVSSNSGTPAIVNPRTGGTGRIVGGALELSNVDISAEFINLITASTGFSANSRVLSTGDRLIQELLASIR